MNATLGSPPDTLLIGGDWQPAGDGRTFSVEDPSSGSLVAQVADATASEAVRALDSAYQARREWSHWAPRDRSELLRRVFKAMVDRAAELSEIMTVETGKPMEESLAEVHYAAEFFRWFSEEACRIDGRWTASPSGNSQMLVTHDPVGCCLLITPWNFPLAMPARKIAPAIAAGCTVVFKPAEATPLSAVALTQILIDCGLPAGVLNLITTSDPGPMVSAMLKYPGLRKLSFTGSTEVGRILTSQASSNLLRVSMELGGNAPFIVFEDADVHQAVQGAMIAKFRNAGQACTAANRFYVHEAVFDEFTGLFADRVAEMLIGPGSEVGVNLGPLIDRSALDRVDEVVRDAKERGAQVLAGGNRIDRSGYFFEPTILLKVAEDCRVLNEEIFGPVAPVVSFSDEGEAIEAANRTQAGLVSYIYTRDLARSFRVAGSIESGMVGVNTGLVSNPAAPFGGVKWSGMGREGGHEGISEYLETKYLALNLG